LVWWHNVQSGRMSIKYYTVQWWHVVLNVHVYYLLPQVMYLAPKFFGLFKIFLPQSCHLLRGALDITQFFLWKNVTVHSLYIKLCKVCPTPISTHTHILKSQLGHTNSDLSIKQKCISLFFQSLML